MSIWTPGIPCYAQSNFLSISMLIYKDYIWISTRKTESISFNFIDSFKMWCEISGHGTIPFSILGTNNWSCVAHCGFLNNFCYVCNATNLRSAIKSFKTAKAPIRRNLACHVTKNEKVMLLLRLVLILHRRYWIIGLFLF